MGSIEAIFEALNGNIAAILLHPAGLGDWIDAPAEL